MNPIDSLITQAHELLNRIEELLPAKQQKIDIESAIAWRWTHRQQQGQLEPISNVVNTQLSDILNLDTTKSMLVQNTEQFLKGLPANNALLWGPRGTGKSSLIRALLNEFQGQGLKLIEVDKEHLVELPDIMQQLQGSPSRFIVYCDDLSFEANDSSYKALKVVLDGSLSETPENLLIYATSNRRHLLPEYQQENLDSQIMNNELHHGEAIEEKISLSDRFGLWLPLHPFSQNDYLRVVDHWLKHFSMPGTEDEETRTLALRWALQRGNRSGRIAWQFARHWAGKKLLEAQS